jgi:hypothetical protein
MAGTAAAPTPLGPAAAIASPHAAAAAPTYLRVSVYCYGTYCEAVARGGTGIYEGFEWSLAEETWDNRGTSGVDATAYCVSGMMLGVSANVTDSSGASAGGSDWVYC